MTPALASAPFAPLSQRELDSGSADSSAEEQPTPIIPVPDGAPSVELQHGRWGYPSATWTYRDGAGRVLGHVVRFETDSGKQILPRTFCSLPGGRQSWCWRSFAKPRPLYGLERLSAHPDAQVLIVEGEKTADAAQRQFPSYIALTWPGGSNAVRMADWSVLAGRRVIVWPDADPSGRNAAAQVAELTLQAGAISVALVGLPSGLPAGWDLADTIPAGLDVAHLIASARPQSPPTELPDGYAMTDRGLVWRDPSNDEKPELWLAGRFHVIAETRDGDGNSWGVLLEWLDHDGRQHRLALPRSSLAGDGADARRLLLDGGLYVAPARTARERLTAFLTAVRSPRRMTATTRIGWHGSSFVLPDECIGVGLLEDLLLQGVGAVEHAFCQRGTLQQWQHQIARYAVGNSRLAVALSAAFASCLLGPCGIESGGLHLRGPSSIGKSTALEVAGSAWGGGEHGYLRSWRATANGLEGVALGHSDTLLCLDELAQIAGREAGEVAYMLANGSGKSRSARDGSARRSARWRLLFLSSGELGLSDKVAEDGRGRRTTAGQEVRIIDVPADPGSGLGLFEDIHGFPSAQAFATHLKSAARLHYGTAARAFLRKIASDLDTVRAGVASHTRDFLARHLVKEADGQVQRVGQRFAVIAAAGELAVSAGILPWPAGEATEAAVRVYEDWLELRGGVEPAEVRNGIAQVRAFLLAHGLSRFVPAWEPSGDTHAPVRDIAGFRKRAGEGWDYFVTSSAWRNEICCGFDGKALAGQLAERHLLNVAESGRHRSKSITVPHYGRLRLYHLPARILEAEGDE